MAENSKIEWTHHTFNPWIGCAKVSAGCKFCYAETLMDTRYGRVEWGVNGTRVRTSPGNWKKPLQWNRQAEKEGVRYRVFCASLADVFEDRPELAPWRAELFALVDATPNLDWLLLTKRPENIARLWVGGHAEVTGLLKRRTNVWLGTSVEAHTVAQDRIRELMKVAHLCRYTFLSCEPLIDEVSLRHVYMIGGGAAVSVNPLTGERNNGNGMRVLMGGPSTYPRINWVIAGGESGQGARRMDPQWARALRDQCAAAGTAFLFKQWGEYNEAGQKVGKHAAGRLLDGVIHDGFPDVAHVKG